MADLLLVEHAAQAADARSAPRGWRIIALSPEAMASLDALRCDYRCPEDYLPTSAVDEVGRASYERVLAFCRSLDRWLAAHSDGVAGSGLEPAQLWHYHFNILAQAVTIRALELRAILDSEQPARVRAFPAAPERLSADMAFRDESIYMRLLPVVARERGVSAEYAATMSRPRPAAKLRRRPSAFIPARWRQRLMQLHALGVTRSRETVSASAPSILVLNATPDIRAVMRAPGSERFRFIHWQGSGSPMSIKPMRLWRDARLPPQPIRAGAEWDASIADFDLVAPDLWPVVESRVRHFVSAVVPEMVQSAAMTDSVIDHYRPALALAGILPDHRASAAAARMRRLGVPLALYQHGGSYGYFDLPVHYYNDLRLADWFLTYGDGVSRELQQRHGRRQPCAKMLAVGSAALSGGYTRKARRASSERPAAPVVLYVATGLMGSRFYAPHFRSCRYYRLLTRVVEALGSVPDIRAVLKLHSRADNCYNPLVDRLTVERSRVEVITHGSLQPWLDVSDLVVMDLPGTPLLEALAAGRPVLAYADPDVFKLGAETRQMLSRDVQLETDEDRFIARLRNVHDELRLGRHEDFSGLDFLREYGTSDGSSNRAAAVLASIATGRQVGDMSLAAS